MEKKLARSSWGKRPTANAAPTIDPVALDEFVSGPTAAKGKRAPEETKVRLNVILPESLHQRVKIACATEKTSMTDVIVAYLEQRFPKQ